MSGSIYESDLSINDPQASHRRMEAERRAVAGIETDELEAGIVQDMIRALSLAVSSDKLPKRWRDQIEAVLARVKRSGP